MNISNNIVRAHENTTAIIIIIIISNSNNNRNITSASLAVLSASQSTRCGAPSGCDGGDCDQIWKLPVNILNMQQRTTDKGCPPLQRLGDVLSSKQRNVTKNFTKFGLGRITSNDARNGNRT